MRLTHRLERSVRLQCKFQSPAVGIEFEQSLTRAFSRQRGSRIDRGREFLELENVRIAPRFGSGLDGT